MLALHAAARGIDVDTLALHEPPLLVDDTRAVPRADFGDRLRAARALASALPDGRHRVLPGQNHNPSMKVQAAVVRELLAPGITARA